VKIDKRLQVLSGNSSYPTLEKLIIELSQFDNRKINQSLNKMSIL